ncbi:MAG: Sec-independent protein translocase protein TatB [Devosia sp.]|jgi:sec-independent protein translocase protein TatB|nr:Sec-independent protein translocase protein TatB [Devosia sp.]
MFGVGWTEMLLIGVVALVVIGPKDMPVVMNRLGKVVATIRRMGGEFQRELNKTTGLDQITDLRRSITEPLKQTAQEITREFNRTTESGAVVPSGAIAPKDPAAESVVAEIHDKVGMTPVEPGSIAPPATAMAAKAGETPAAVESPAPVEAIAPAKPKAPRKPRAKAAPAAAATAEPVQKIAETPAAKPKKPAAPRKPRTPKPKADA